MTIGESLTALNALAVSDRDRGDDVAAQDNFEASLSCWRKVGDKIAAARCLHNLANVAESRQDYPRAQLALMGLSRLSPNSAIAAAQHGH